LLMAHGPRFGTARGMHSDAVDSWRRRTPRGRSRLVSPGGRGSDRR
jgi:hypothetical protein